MLNAVKLIDDKMDRVELYGQLPYPKWKRTNIELTEEDFLEDVAYEVEFLPGNLRRKDDEIELEKLTRGHALINRLSQFEEKQQKGVDKKLTLLTEQYFNGGIALSVKKSQRIKQPIFVSYEMNKKNSYLLDYNLIWAEPNSSVTVVFDQFTGDESQAFHNGVTKVVAESDATVNIIKIQRMNELSSHFDANIAHIGKGANVNYLTIELGSQITGTSIVANLNGEYSKSEVDVVYFGDKRKALDLEYTMNHFGKRSESNIDCKGALKNEAVKVFRGNLDFKRGSQRARGSENESVTLLDPRVKADAIPTLFCSEDDVIGEHAASAGQISDNLLMYIMSRGLSETEAKKLIVEASFTPIIDKIPDENIRGTVYEYLQRRLIHYENNR